MKRHYDFKRGIVSNLAMNIPPSFLPQLVDSAIQTTHKEEEILRGLKEQIHVVGEVAYVLNIPFSQGKTATYTRALADTSVGIAGEERKEVVDLSLRTSVDRIDLNRILRRITPNLGGSGGGQATPRLPGPEFQRRTSRNSSRD